VNESGKRRCVPVLLFLLVAALSAQAQTSRIFAYNGRIPLGIESFRLQPGGREFYLMASAENPAFDGLSRVTDHGGHDHLVGGANKPVLFYPTRVKFRLTASAREKLVEDRPFDTHQKIEMGDLLKQLRFRVKVFHALEYRYIKPTAVEVVGVPSDLPYDERIYQIQFELGAIPIEDRVVMEVLSPSGERLCKFHLDLL